MMNTLKNNVRLLGHVWTEPNLLNLENKSIMTKVPLATNERYKDADGEIVQDTQWHTLVFFGKLAQYVAEYLKKGSEIAVEGRLKNRSYEDKNGVTRYVTEVIVNNVMFIKSK